MVINKPDMKLSLIVSLVFAICPLQSNAVAELPRPNILLILCDDLGYADVGFNGSTDITTPHLDSLAKNGTVCTSGYVAHPFCGPSRMGLMTGSYPHSYGAPYNLPPSGLDIQEYADEGIPTSEVMMSTMLQKAGYFTGAVGKWHLGFTEKYHPNARGFDDFYGFLGGGHKYFPEVYGPIYERQSRSGRTVFNEYITPLEHNGKTVKETEYMTDALSREAVRFIDEAADKDSPFFLYLAYNAPHTPLEATEEDLAKFAHISDEKRRTYAAMVYAVDRGVGRIVESLKQTEALDDTLILFFSDNGGKIGAGANNAPLTQGKGSICEGGYRVPMFFHWPKQVAAGKKYDYPVSALDLYPTFARLAGTKIPEGQKIDGKDIWDAFTNGQNTRPDESIFAMRHWNGFHNVGIRMNDWKASKRGPNAAWQLFDLTKDIGEQDDISAQHPDVVAKMVADAKQWSTTHTTPRWFDNWTSAQHWRQTNMPRYKSTFSLTKAPSKNEPTALAAGPVGKMSGKTLASGENKKTGANAPPSRSDKEPVKKKSPSDKTLEEFVEIEKAKWQKNGWRWNQKRVEEIFGEMDEDDDGLASGRERQKWYKDAAAKKKAQTDDKKWLGLPAAANKSSSKEGLRQDAPVTKQGKPNVLFIAIDDLRPELGCYGSPIAVTPNLDRIAKSGLLFNRAYCQQAICRPSRASLMTGTRPETTGLFHNYVSLRELQPDILTLPQHFIAHGYETSYVGKIFHNGDTDEENSWSRPPVQRVPWSVLSESNALASGHEANVEQEKNNGPAANAVGLQRRFIPKPQGAFRLPENIRSKADNFKKMFAKYGEAAKRGLASGPAFEKADVPDHAYPDGYNTRLAIETMKEMAEADKPFFLGMGYKLPHLNWCSPTKYWDMYDPTKIPLETAAAAPENGAAMGLHASFELRVRSNIPKYGPIPPDLARTLKHAYLASTSYVDSQIGLLLKSLEELQLSDNTIIVVWGDHGWHLGDMGVWGKATNYEIATRVPLMISAPKMTTRGAKTDALVELVDIFPTLCELADIPLPKHLEGHSFVPLLDEPDQTWKTAAYSQYPNPALREWAANPLSVGMRETWFGPLIKDVEQKIIDQQGDKWNRDLFEKHLMGYTMRTNRYRLVVWKDHRNSKADPIFVELFDHEADPQETKNVATEQPRVVEELMSQMNAGWKSVLQEK